MLRGQREQLSAPRWRPVPSVTRCFSLSRTSWLPYFWIWSSYSDGNTRTQRSRSWQLVLMLSLHIFFPHKVAAGERWMRRMPQSPAVRPPGGSSSDPGTKNSLNATTRCKQQLKHILHLGFILTDLLEKQNKGLETSCKVECSLCVCMYLQV